MPFTLAASDMLTNFSANVAALRKGLGWSQEDLASRLKVARTTISNWEKGVAYPSFSDLLELAIVLRTTMDELVGEAKPSAGGKQDLFSAVEAGRPNIVLLDRGTVDTLPAHVDLAAHFKGMPAFRLPEQPFREGLFICLQYLGDAMAPTLRSSEWLVARHVPVGGPAMHVGDVFIVATALGVVCRRLIDLTPAKRGTGRAVFASDNATYAPMEITTDRIIHLFECQARLSYQFENPLAGVRPELHALPVVRSKRKRT